MTLAIFLAIAGTITAVVFGFELWAVRDKLADCEAALTRAKDRNAYLARRLDELAPGAMIYDLLQERIARDRLVLDEADETVTWEGA